MYKVIIPARVQNEIFCELEFWSEKNLQFTERVAVELDFHLNKTLKNTPGFGAIRAKKAGLLYYLVQERFKHVFEIDEMNKQVVVHYFFNTKKEITNYI